MKDQVSAPWASFWRTAGPTHVLHRFEAVFTDKDRKPLPRVMREFLMVSLKTKGLATHYFSSFLYRKAVENVMDYLGNNEMKRIQLALANRQLVAMLGNKLFFYEHYRKSNIPLPRLLAYNLGQKLFLFTEGERCEACEIRSRNEMQDGIKRMFSLSPGSSIFVKPITASGGSGIRWLSSGQNGLPDAEIKELHDSVSSGCFMFQEKVAQNEEMSRLYPSSVNTVRVDTFTEPGKDPRIISMFVRVGANGSIVDNIAAGGLFIGIDAAKGTLRGVAYQKLGKGAAVFTSHPNTGVPFKGFRIPFFEEVKQLAVLAARWLPESLVGWDIAVSSKGPVLIEGNWYYDMQLSDVAYGGYRRNPAFLNLERYVRKSTESPQLSTR